MSVRRRAITARVETRERNAREFAEQSAYLDQIQQVIDSFKAEGRIKVCQAEFSARLDSIRAVVSEVSAP